MPEEKKIEQAAGREVEPQVKDPIEAAEIQNEETVQDPFPSLEGDKVTEVSKRNLHSPDGKRFVRQFVVLKRDWNGDDYQHTANIKHTREEMLHVGLRATGDVTFDGQEQHPTDEKSIVLTYSGPTIPAVVAQDAGKQPRYVLQQQLMDQGEYDPTPSGIEPEDVAKNRGGAQSQVKDK